MSRAEGIVSEELVSIIMPACNCGAFIGEAIRSVLAQNYDNWELLVVDDASSDDTPPVVETFARKDPRIRYTRLPVNSGPAAARNKAMEEAKGRYFAFLDCDDLWFPEKLSRQIGLMRTEGYTFTCTAYTKIDEKGNDLGRVITPSPRLDHEGLLRVCPGNSTVVFDALELGRFRIPPIRKRNDYALWLQVIKKAGYLYGINESLGSHRVRKGALSANKASLVRYHWKIYREMEAQPFLKSCYLVLYWVIATAFRLR